MNRLEARKEKRDVGPGNFPLSAEKEQVRTVAETLNKSSAYLERKGLENPRLDAEVMLGHVLGLKRIELYLDHDRPMQDHELMTFRSLVKRRLAGCPVQYLTGETEFFSLSFQISSDALIPRPETEILVEAVLKHLKSRAQPLKVADVGTGCGIIAINLAVHLPQAQLWATDCSQEALALARRNAERHGVTDRISFHQGDLYNPLRGLEGAFAAVVCNPPYVSSDQLEHLPREIRFHEPLVALDGGPDGLDVIRRIVLEAPSFLAAGGILALEVGAGQAPSVEQLIVSTKAFRETWVVEDYARIERVVLAERKSIG
jgi:release factor glutamine methyltransferase